MKKIEVNYKWHLVMAALSGIGIAHIIIIIIFELTN